MRYKVTLKSGEVHEFDSPFHPDSLRKSMNLPLTAKIEVISNGQENSAAEGNRDGLGQQG